MSSVVEKRAGKSPGFYAKIGPLAGRPKYVWRKLEATNRKAADRELIEKEADFRRKMLGKSGKRVRFSDAIDEYIIDKLPQLKIGTQETYLGPLNNFRKFFGKKYLDAITRQDLLAYRKHREKDGVANATMLGDFRVLSTFYAACDAAEYLSANPVPGFLKSQSDLKPSEPRTRYLSHNEEHDLIVAAAKMQDKKGKSGKTRAPPFWRLLIEVAIDTGLRAEELFSLQYGDIDFTRKRARVRADVAKNSKSRFVPLLSRAYEALLILSQKRKILMGGSVPSSAYIFARSSGARYEKFRKPWGYTIEAAEIADLDFHDLRRTCGCRLLQDHRMRMHEVSRWLGHSSVEVTEKHYAFLEIDHLEDVVDEARASGARDKALKNGNSGGNQGSK